MDQAPANLWLVVLPRSAVPITFFTRQAAWLYADKKPGALIAAYRLYEEESPPARPHP